MFKLIDEYLMRHLSLALEEAHTLHDQYLSNYGLAVEGVVRHHGIDPLHFNEQVDDALPLDELLGTDQKLRAILQAMDKSKVKLWLFTNAYVDHGMRVVRLLGIDDLFEGITYCDYAALPMLRKPQKGMFQKAMREAGAKEGRECYFIGMY